MARPRKGLTFRELIRGYPLADKREVVAKLYEMAKDGHLPAIQFLMTHADPAQEMPMPAGGVVNIAQFVLSNPDALDHHHQLLSAANAALLAGGAGVGGESWPLEPGETSGAAEPQAD